MMERVRGRDTSSRDLAIAQKVLNHDVKLVEENLVEQVDDNDVHGLGTSAAGYPCTTALLEANVRPRQRRHPKWNPERP